MKTTKPVIFLTFANDKVDDALYLRNLPLELNGIRTALDKAVKAGLCEVVERTAATVEDIFNTFQDPYYQDRIAVFHYGGHASGTQLMLETLDGGHGESHSDGLVPFFGKQKSLKLVFFNGCSSQQQATEMIDAGVPAVVGTSMAIKDSIATELSGRFYNGLASGHSIHQSWLEAIDIVKTKNNTKKKRGLKLRRDKGADFPWTMYIREGAEVVKDWDLPSASNNPLFGLPELPKMDLPEAPFRFLRRYEPKHAEIFFGRDRYIRQLYDRITSEKAAPVILFYGQSGAGKSSTLASGLLPRLEQEADVKYVRRDAELGLLSTLDEALGGDFKSAVVKSESGQSMLASELTFQIQQLKVFKNGLNEEEQYKIQQTIDMLNETFQELDIQPESHEQQTRLERWLAIEAETARPFHILLDQVEETFTRYNPALTNELETLLVEIQTIFAEPNHRPKGKIILSYRKEYNPEIEEQCKKLQIPREKIFLKKIDREDIIEIVNGIQSSERLQQYYRTSIEPTLPSVIADNILEDQESPLAPVLSILLTKLWEIAHKDDSETATFTVAQYQQLKKEGILMDDFFHQQMEKVKEWQPHLIESGLALDVLNFHTTHLGTAGSQSIENIKHRYEHKKEELDGLLKKLKQLYLLTDGVTGYTTLAHDTIAPIVKEELQNSDKSGQRAFRILTSKVNEFKENKKLILGVPDLKVVEEGGDGMRLWTKDEEQLIEFSRKHRDKLERRNRNLKIATITVSIIIIGLSIWSYMEMLQTKGNNLAARSILSFTDRHYTESGELAHKSFDYTNNTSAYYSLLKSTYVHVYAMDERVRIIDEGVVDSANNQVHAFITDDVYATPRMLEQFNDLEQIQFSTVASELILFGINKENRDQSEIHQRNISGETLATFQLDKNEKIFQYAISDNGQFLVTFGQQEQTKNSTLKIWSIVAQNIVYTYDFPNDDEQGRVPIWSFSAKHTYFAFSYKNEETRVVELNKQSDFSIKGGLSGLYDKLHRAKHQFEHFSPDEQFLITKHGKIFNLATKDHHSEQIKIVSTSSKNPDKPLNTKEIADAKFTSDGKKVILSNPTTLWIYSFTHEKNVFKLSIVPHDEHGRSDDSYLSADGRYSISKDFGELYDIPNHVYMGDRDGTPAGIHLGKKHFATNFHDKTILHELKREDIKRDADDHFPVSGSFKAFSSDGNYMITTASDKYNYVWLLHEHLKPTLLTALIGEFIDISLDNRYCSTTYGVFDLKQNQHLMGVQWIKGAPYSDVMKTHYSDDGKYIVLDDSIHFEIRDALTGEIPSNDIVKKYKKEEWKPFKDKHYTPFEVQKSFFNEEAYKLPEALSPNGEFLIQTTDNKFLLTLATDHNTRMKLDAMGEKIISYRFKDNDGALEITSATQSGNSEYYFMYRQLFWLDREMLIRMREE